MFGAASHRPLIGCDPRLPLAGIQVGVADLQESGDVLAIVPGGEAEILDRSQRSTATPKGVGYSNGGVPARMRLVSGLGLTHGLAEPSEFAEGHEPQYMQLRIK